MNDQTLQEILAQKRLDRDRNGWADYIASVTPEQVDRELAKPAGRYDIYRLAALVSPAARHFLEPMAQQARQLTIQRFGRTIQLYAPLYVSNVCVNSCRYCGYNRHSAIQRVRLSVEQVIQEAQALAAQGFRHLLLVSGEDPDFITVDYLRRIAAPLRQTFSSLAIEIQPLSQSDYAELFAAGIEGVTLYQETYDRQTYAAYHPAGPKRDYDWRLNAPDRFAAAGMRRLGIGALLGLADWRVETLALAEHASYLIKRYWQSGVDISFPRIRPAADVQDQWPYAVLDADLAQMMIALRLCFADVGLVLSTRESAAFRDAMMSICVTRVSAGSRTNPGGYALCPTSGRQFEIADHRSPQEVADTIVRLGYEPVWKDWDAAFLNPTKN